jgi:hypothetical protein
MKAWITAAVAIGITMGSAAPAWATEDVYVQQLQERYPFLSADQLLTEGHRVCQVLSQGHTGTDALLMVKRDLSVSTSTASIIVGEAVREFDC